MDKINETNRVGGLKRGTSGRIPGLLEEAGSNLK